MTLISIANKKARPVNPHPYIIRVGGKDLSITKVNTEWEAFEQSVTEHEAPGCEEGEAEGELIYQVERVKYLGSDRTGYTLIDILSAKATYNKEWVECSKSAADVFNSQKVIEAFGKFKTRQIWRIVPTPEKVEVKEPHNWISVEDRLPGFNELVLVYTKLKSRLTAKLKKDNKWEVAFGDRDNSYVTHWQPLPSPPTH